MDEKKREARIDITGILFRLIVALFCFIPITAFSLGVGQVKVLSALNQPLNAEIPLLSAKSEDLAELSVRVSSQTFEGVGGADAGFGYSVESRGKRNFIRITSKQAIREPLLNFLLEVEWPKGRLLREFAVLLNPPSFVTRDEPEVSPPATPPTPPKVRSKRTRPAGSRTTAKADPAEVSPPKPAAEPAPPPPDPIAESETASTSFSGTYGPVRRGETLWNIAERVRPNASVSVPRMMRELLKHNRQAFVRNNINTLMAGTTLRIPAFEGVSSTQTLASQNQSSPPQIRPETTQPTDSAPASAMDSTAAMADAASQPSATITAESSSGSNPQVRLLPPEQTDQPAISSEFRISLNDDRLNLSLVDLPVLRDRIRDAADANPDRLRPVSEESETTTLATTTDAII